LGNQPFSVVAADLNGDGKLDLVCANQNDNTLTVFDEQRQRHLRIQRHLSTMGNIPTSVAAADVTGMASWI